MTGVTTVRDDAAPATWLAPGVPDGRATRVGAGREAGAEDAETLRDPGADPGARSRAGVIPAAGDRTLTR